MYEMNISMLKDCHSDDVYQEEHKKHTNSEKSANLDESSFPSIESVLSDIEEYLETRGLVA